MKSLPLLALIGTISIGTAFANVYVPTQIKHNYEHCGSAYCDYQNLPPPPKLMAVSLDTRTGAYGVATSYGHFQSDVSQLIKLSSNSCRLKNKQLGKSHLCNFSKPYFFENNTAHLVGHAIIARGINPDIKPNKKGYYSFAYQTYITSDGNNIQSYEQRAVQDCRANGWEGCQIVFHGNERQW